MTARPIAGSPLSAADLSFGYADQPRQRTTMGMLLLLDRAPDARRLEAAAWRTSPSTCGATGFRASGSIFARTWAPAGRGS